MSPRYAIGDPVELRGNLGKVVARAWPVWSSRWRYVVELAPGVEMGAQEYELEPAARPATAARAASPPPAVVTPAVASSGQALDDMELRYSLMELD